jgi:hypothetical protein
MEDMRFADVMKRERERLNREREEIVTQQQELENKLTEIDRELAAIDAYAAAKSGKIASPRRPARGSPKGRASVPASPGEARARLQRETRRGALLQVIRENPDGLTRGEILERMSLKGDKPAAKSISNALTALTKTNRVLRRDGKYLIGT